MYRGIRKMRLVRGIPANAMFETALLIGADTDDDNRAHTRERICHLTDFLYHSTLKSNASRR